MTQNADRPERRERDVDEMIRTVLDEAEAERYAKLGEPSVASLVLSTFQGRYWWLNLLGGVFILLFLFLALFSAVRFFEAETTRDQLLAMGSFFFGLTMVLALKVWTWMEMQRNLIGREIKRLELQVAQLTARLESAVALGDESTKHDRSH